MAGMREALALAAGGAGLTFECVPDEGDVVRLLENGMHLMHGPDANADAIATMACWVIVEQRGESGEDAVRAELEVHGFRYVAPLEARFPVS